MLGKTQRGDTLIEVLLAMSVLSLAVVGTLSIMNFGFAKNLDTGIRSRVQAELNGQANILRAVRDSSAANTDVNGDWAKVMAKSVSASLIEPDGCTPGANPFVFTTNGDWTNPVTVSAGRSSEPVPTPGNGIWIEAYKHTSPQSVDYYDFYVKACWQGNQSNQQLKSVVRLYAPES